MTPIPAPVAVDLNSGITDILLKLKDSIGAAMSINLSASTKTANFTIPDDESAPGVVISDASGGDQTITLPNTATTSRGILFVRHEGANATTIAVQGSDKIADPRGGGGATTLDMMVDGDLIGFAMTDGFWRVLMATYATYLDVAVVGPTQLNPFQRTVFVDTTAAGADVTIKLPTPSKVTGETFIVIKKTNPHNVIVSTEDGSDVIQTGDDTLGAGELAGTYFANVDRYWKLGEVAT